MAVIRPSTRAFISALAAVVWVVAAFAGPAFCGPASPDPVTLTQPDGSSFTAFIRGDEFQGWMETDTGFTILKDRRTNSWRYAEEGPDGKLRPSSMSVRPGKGPPPETPRRLKPPRDTKREKSFSDRVIRRGPPPGRGESPGSSGSAGAPAFSSGAATSSVSTTQSVNPANYWYPYPVSGTRNLLVVLVNFMDRTLVTTPDDWYGSVFDNSSGVRSVVNFYADNSFGALDIAPVPNAQPGSPDGVVVADVLLNHPDCGSASDYGTETAWLNAALADVSPFVNFTSFDTNDDGVFQNEELVVYFVLAGYEASGSSKHPNIWAHAWGGSGVTAGGVGLEQWALNGELNNSDVQHTMGVIAHELGHSMCGLPDLYDTTYTNSGMGGFSAMAAGSWGRASTDTYSGATPVAMDAWSRRQVGWSSPRDISGGCDASFPPALSAPDAPLMMNNTSLSATEFFLAENRYPAGWDLGLERWLGPSWGGGLLIQHIDITVGTSYNDGTPGANDINKYVSGGHQGVMVEEASTLNGSLLDGSSLGNVTHLFYDPNNTDFADGTSPGSRLYDGTSTGLGLYSIGAQAVIMTGHFAVPGSAVATPTEGSYLFTNSTTVTGTASDGCGAGLQLVEVSWDDGANWYPATDTSGDGSWSSWSYVWTLPSYGFYDLVSRAADNDGRLQSAYTAVPVIVGPPDSNPPTGSVTVAGGDAAVPTGDVVLTLSASDDGLGVASMRISDDGVFDTEPWEDLSQYRTWSLSNQTGFNTVSVTFRDWAGNESGAFTDGITVVPDTSEPDVLWSRSDGTVKDDFTDAVAYDGSDGIYTAGSTFGNLDWGVNAGFRDIALMRFNKRGNRLWSKEIGTDDYDRAYAVASDPSGNAYVAGYAAGPLDGNTYSGWQDMVLLKYSVFGELLWSRQIGTPGVDIAYAVALGPSGEVYVAGSSEGDFDGHIGAGDYDYFIVKYDGDGNEDWSVLDGTIQYDTVRDMSVDSAGNIYVSGYTYPLGGDYHNPAPSDIFFAKYSSTGGLLWNRTFDSLDTERSYGVEVAPSGDVYVCGYTGGSLAPGAGAGGYDAVLMKLGADGSTVWVWQLGSVMDDIGFSVETDASGNVYVAGYTYGDMAGTNAGESDLMAMKFDPNGTRVWTWQAGLSSFDYLMDLVSVGDGVCLAGYEYVTTADGGNNDHQFRTIMLGKLAAHCENTVQDADETGVDCGGADCVSCDFDQPEADITYPFTGTYVAGPDITVTGTAFDTGGSGLDYVELSTDGGVTWTNATGTDPWRYDWTAIPDGTYSLACRAVDAAGNTGFARDGIVITVGPPDGTAPSGSVSIEGGEDYTIYETVTLSISATDDISGVTHMRLSSDGVFDDEPWENYTSVRAWTLTGGRGVNTVYAEFRDFALNVSSPVSDDIYYSNSSYAFDTLWTSLDGTSSDETAYDIAVDPTGNSYTVGETAGVLYGAGYGGTDMYITKRDTDGNVLWVRQLGGAGNDKATDVAIATDGSVYITGEATNGFDGSAAAGGVSDVFTVKYGPDGSKAWSRLNGSVSTDTSGGVGVDGAGNVYVSGTAFAVFNGQPHIAGGDYFVMKYSPSGVLQWTLTGGTAGYEGVKALLVDREGDTYITGYTSGDLGGYVNQGNGDFYLVRFDPSGNEVFTRQVGTYNYDSGFDMAQGIDGDIYISGASLAAFDGNAYAWGYDVILVKYSPDGDKLWSAEAGSVNDEYGYAIAAAPGGGVYVAGKTNGVLEGGAGLGLEDVFVMKYDPSGRRLWTRQLGTAASDIAYGAGTDSFGNLYIAGVSSGDIGGETSNGLADGFSMKTGVAQSMPELTHYDFAPYLTGGDCTSCHAQAQTFSTGYDISSERSFCGACHNPAGVAHESNIYVQGMHGGFGNVTSQGFLYPTYGNITAGEYDNRPYANLGPGGTVVCATCHNVMRKTEDIGRVWEPTTTSDNLMYTLQFGPWSDYGYVEPVVYRDTSLWTGPYYSSDRGMYEADPSEYVFDESAGTVTFLVAQDPSVYVYVTLRYPSIRANNSANKLCADCHPEQTHMSANCLTCHAPHGSGNLEGIRETVRTTDRSGRTVVFTNRTGTNSFADGDGTYDGVCEVCHTSTKYHTRDGSGFVNHSGGFDYSGADCTACHTHQTGFAK